jgi:hypothetical protein
MTTRPPAAGIEEPKTRTKRRPYPPAPNLDTVPSFPEGHDFAGQRALTVDQFAGAIPMATATVYGMVEHGEIAFVKRGQHRSARLLIPSGEIERVQRRRLLGSVTHVPKPLTPL